MTNYRFVFLNCNQTTIDQNAADSAAAALAEQWNSGSTPFHKIIASTDRTAAIMASAIQEHIPSEIEYSPLWESLQLDASGDNPVSNNSGYQQYLHAGQALHTLIDLHPDNYLIITHHEIIHSIVSAISGGTPWGTPPNNNIHLTHNTYLTLEFDPQDLHWHFIELVQPNTPHPPNPQPNGYHFTFIRHGQSLGNLKRVFQGQKEYPLSEEGLKQAHKLADRLKKANQDYDALFSSPQERALGTAKIISEKLGLDIKVMDIWKEIDNGNFAGLTRKELIEKYPNQDNRFNSYLPLGDIGESWWQLYLRSGQALSQLLANPPGKYLLIAHGAILNAAVRSIFGIAPQPGRLTPAFHFENTGGANLSYNPETQTWQFLSLSPSIQL